MSLSRLFDTLAGRQRQREQARADDFRGLVAAIAAGREPDADHVDRVLAAAGRTVDDLRAAVGRHQHRLDLRARLDALPAIEAEQREVRKKVAKADEELTRAEDRHAEAVAPLRARLDALRVSILDAERCRRELVTGCTDPALLAELAAVTEKLRQARERQQAANEALSRQQSFEVGGNEAAVFEGTREQTENARRAHAAGAWERELAEAQKRIAALEKEEAVIYERMLVP
jgi:hypothetical protein